MEGSLSRFSIIHRWTLPRETSSTFARSTFAFPPRVSVGRRRTSMKLFARLGKSIDVSAREATSRPFSCFVIKKQKSAKDRDRRRRVKVSEWERLKECERKCVERTRRNEYVHNIHVYIDLHIHESFVSFLFFGSLLIFPKKESERKRDGACAWEGRKESVRKGWESMRTRARHQECPESPSPPTPMTKKRNCNAARALVLRVLVHQRALITACNAN